MTDEVVEMRVGVVGRVVSGKRNGFFIEVDDDSERPHGSGGWYVLVWGGETAYDDWFESKGHVIEAFTEGEYGQVEWLSPEQSAKISGRHRHGESHP